MNKETRVTKALKLFEREEQKKNQTLLVQLCKEIELRQTKIGRLLVSNKKPLSGK